MTERDPYEKTVERLLKDEKTNLKWLAVKASQDFHSAEKCGCSQCNHQADQAYLKWEEEDDRINGHYHSDHEEDRLFDFAFKRIEP